MLISEIEPFQQIFHSSFYFNHIISVLLCTAAMLAVVGAAIEMEQTCNKAVFDEAPMSNIEVVISECEFE